VTLFLREDFNLRLRPKLLKELKPGARIVSNTFDMYDWKGRHQSGLTCGDSVALLSGTLGMDKAVSVELVPTCQTASWHSWSKTG